MATVKQRGAAFQLRVKNRLLPKPFYATFDTEIEAKAYGEALEAMLSKGVVPAELLSVPKTSDDPLIARIVSEYIAGSPAITQSDEKLLRLTERDKPLLGLRLSGLTYRWAEGYVAWLKSPAMNITPSSIRKRVGALARMIDWQIKRTTADNATPIANVLRMLPRGYSNYTRADAERAPARRDKERDRRLTGAEADQIEATLAGIKREDRERALPEDPAFALMYRVIVDTGLRLFEAYRLRVDSFDFVRNIIHVDGSKGHRGYIKPRVVPIKKPLREPLREWCEGRVGLIFPYWCGDEKDRPRVTSLLSRRFGTLFDYAKVPDFTEHDLRHEAACRWFELRRDDGAWMFSDIEIARIMGWSSLKMAMRYASLRGEDLAARLG